MGGGGVKDDRGRRREIDWDEEMEVDRERSLILGDWETVGRGVGLVLCCFWGLVLARLKSSESGLERVGSNWKCKA